MHTLHTGRIWGRRNQKGRENHRDCPRGDESKDGVGRKWQAKADSHHKLNYDSSSYLNFFKAFTVKRSKEPDTLYKLAIIQSRNQ